MRGYRLLADEAVLVMRSDRRSHLPYGLSGGSPGTPSWNVLNPGKNQRLLPTCPMASVPMIRDDEFLHIQAGAGGFGEPLERNPESVLSDILNELITKEYAIDIYGVVTLGDKVDVGATTTRRAALKSGGRAQKSHLGHFYETVGIPPHVPLR